MVVLPKHRTFVDREIGCHDDSFTQKESLILEHIMPGNVRAEGL